MKILRRTVELRPFGKGTECLVRGRSVLVLHQTGGYAFVKTTDDRADQWTAWIPQAELSDGW